MVDSVIGGSRTSASAVSSSAAYLRLIWALECLRCQHAPTAAVADASDEPAIGRFAPDRQRRGEGDRSRAEDDEDEPDRLPDREQVEDRGHEDGQRADPELDRRQPERDRLVADGVLGDLDEAAFVHVSVRSGPGPDMAAGMSANGSTNMSSAQPVARPSSAFVSPTVGGFPSGPMCPSASRLKRTKTIVQANRTTQDREEDLEPAVRDPLGRRQRVGGEADRADEDEQALDRRQRRVDHLEEGHQHGRGQAGRQPGAVVPVVRALA